jgi:DNA-binding transcriptional LysR family regulator
MGFFIAKKLKYFMTVMEKRCLTKASETLCITRSPLGKAISDLEQSIGVPLFIRQHGDFVPTDIAIRIYEQTKPIYNKLEFLESKIKRTGSPEQANIIIDERFPDNLVDLYQTAIRSNDISCHFQRECITQLSLDTWNYAQNVIIITTSPLRVIEPIVVKKLTSSGFLLLVSKKLYHEGQPDPVKLSNLPLIFRKNTLHYNQNYILSYIKDKTGHQFSIQHIDGNITDFLSLIGQGVAAMLLPLKTCDAFNISRENCIPLFDKRMTTYFYYKSNHSNDRETAEVVKIFDSII